MTETEPGGALSPVSENDRMLAALAHGSAVLGFGGWGPLLLWLMYKDKSDFVAYHALQAAVAQLLITFAIIFVAIITCGLGVVLLLPWMAWEVWHGLKAYEGQWRSYPMMESVGRQHLPKG
ncbi:MAG: DUF4870 domain-containing protein [Alphaproteobacteria bacterium]|nr:DUF4870 domain-containing protein [Alphaproteobacteria bacterium]